MDRKIKKIVYRIDQLREKPNNERQFLVNRFLNHKYRIEWFFKNIFCLQLSFCRKITGKYEENESLNTESNCAKYSNTNLNETMRQRQTCLSKLNTWKLAIKFDVSVKWYVHVLTRLSPLLEAFIDWFYLGYLVLSISTAFLSYSTENEKRKSGNKFYVFFLNENKIYESLKTKQTLIIIFPGFWHQIQYLCEREV